MGSEPVFKLSSNDTVVVGEIAVGTAAAQFPDIAVREVVFKMDKASAGTVYIGAGTAAAVVGTATNTTTGIQLIAGDQTPAFTISNLNKFYGIASAAGQIVTYLGTL